MLSESNPGKKQNKPVLQYSINGDFIREWVCIKVAAKAIDIDRSAISRVCNKKPKCHTAKGFIWKFHKEI